MYTLQRTGEDIQLCLLCHDELAVFNVQVSVTEGDSSGCWIYFNDLNLQDAISAVSKAAGLTTVADAACFSILLQRGPADGFPSLTAASGREGGGPRAPQLKGHGYS